jgi:hypothetical protein
MKNQAIVPVTYMGGTGGQFVSALCYAARHSNYDGIKFSKFGNAHLSTTDFFLPGDFTNSVDKQIEKILSVDTPSPPYHVGMHLRDIDRVMDVFQRAIRITYSQNDIEDLAAIFLGKWGIDSNFCNLDDLENFQLTYRKRIFFLNKNLEYWQPKNNFGDRLLYISWRDLYKNSIDDLTKKLSTFIGFKFDSIVVEKIAEWRSLTENGLDNLKIIMEK